jgi:hypothetical protein
MSPLVYHKYGAFATTLKNAAADDATMGCMQAER